MSNPTNRKRCTKRRFRDRIAAELALATIFSRGEAREKAPDRTYRCPLCAGWHLTSQPLRAQERAA